MCKYDGVIRWMDAGTHEGDNINLRSAVLHIIGDLVQSIGVALAGALIWWKQVGHLTCLPNISHGSSSVRIPVQSGHLCLSSNLMNRCDPAAIRDNRHAWLMFSSYMFSTNTTVQVPSVCLTVKRRTVLS